MSVFSYLALFIGITYSSLVHSQNELCSQPLLNEKMLSEIVRKARVDYPEIPQKNPDDKTASIKIKVARFRCHYQYMEDDPRTKLMVFFINQNGMVVDYLRGSLTSRKECFFKPKLLSQQDLGQKLTIARKADKSLPSEPKGKVVSVSKWGCGYLYAENVNVTKGNVFVMDAFGDVYDFWTER